MARTKPKSAAAAKAEKDNQHAASNAAESKNPKEDPREDPKAKASAGEKPPKPMKAENASGAHAYPSSFPMQSVIELTGILREGGGLLRRRGDIAQHLWTIQGFGQSVLLKNDDTPQPFGAAGMLDRGELPALQPGQAYLGVRRDMTEQEKNCIEQGLPLPRPDHMVKGIGFDVNNPVPLPPEDGGPKTVVQAPGQPVPPPMQAGNAYSKASDAGLGNPTAVAAANAQRGQPSGPRPAGPNQQPFPPAMPGTAPPDAGYAPDGSKLEDDEIKALQELSLVASATRGAQGGDELLAALMAIVRAILAKFHLSF